MDEKASIELLKDMVEIYSPSDREEALANFLGRTLVSLGFKNVWTGKAGNVYGEVGSGHPTVLLCGHMDTVPGRIPVKIEENRLHGRGAVDAKASLAAMISAASSLRHETRKGRVIVAGVVEEEKTSRGIRQLIGEDLGVDYAIFGEPSGVQNIAFAYKGKLGLQIRCRTVSGHVGAQHLLDNAIEKSFELWNNLKASSERYRSQQGVFYSLTPCLTSVVSRRTSGGVPDHCVTEVDLRLPPTVKSERALLIAEEVVDDFRAANQDVSVSLRVTDRVEAFVSERTTLTMEALRGAILEETGAPAKFIRKTGTSDMNIFGAASKVPVAAYGPGDAHLSHTNCECIELADYLTGVRVYKKAVERILSQASLSSRPKGY